MTINKLSQIAICKKVIIFAAMRTYKFELDVIATDILVQASEGACKPNYSNRDFINALIIFQTALMDKMYDNQDFDKMPMAERLKMAQSCGEELRKIVFTYTGLDTHKSEIFL
jgi:hypothetical protein